MLQSINHRRPLYIILAASLFIFATSNVYGQYLKMRDFGGSDQGMNPFGAVATDGTYLYGTARYGGTNNYGTVFRVMPDGSNFEVLHNFDQTAGSQPYGALLLEGSTLYGTTLTGGDFLNGTIFKINTDGTAFATLFSFHYGPTGGYPFGGLISDGSVFYGMTSQGGAHSGGTVYKINKDGTGHTLLSEFDYTTENSPLGELAYDGSFLYGTLTYYGGSATGALFKVQTDGNNYEKIFDFGGSNGEEPLGSPFYDGVALWGTTHRGGSSSVGVVYRVNTDGSGYSHMDFFGGNGQYPKGSLVSDGTYLYGTTSFTVSSSNGTIFRIKIADPTIEALGSLGSGMSGPQPEGTLTIIGSQLFGMTNGGGYSYLGNIYKADKVDAENYSIVHSFERSGKEPLGTLVSDNTYLYGITSSGGLYDRGTVYAIKPDGSDYKKLYDFDETTSGGRPYGSLYLAGGLLYGTTTEGGANNLGTIFKIGADGSGFTVLMNFDGSTGSYPTGGLTSDGTNLFGTTSQGGDSNYGTVFRVQPDGSNYIKLYEFEYTHGGYPQSELLFDAGFLYGLTSQGGLNGDGVAFKIDTDGNNFAVIHDFKYDTDGSNPRGSLTSDANYLYGMTSSGGVNNAGTIYRLKRDGTGFENLMDFDSDVTGGGPTGSFIINDTYLYAGTQYGGLEGKGTMFKIKPDGTGFEKLMDFNDGEQPSNAFYSDGVNLWGTTVRGGDYAFGTLFRKPLGSSLSISNFFPERGSIGTYITINGTGFSATPTENIVNFNGWTAVVVSSTANQIVAIVPPDATTGPIRVMTSGGDETSHDTFEVTDESELFNGKVVTCNAIFVTGGFLQYDETIETFIPATAGGKLKVTFTQLAISDELSIYDGPDKNSPLVKTLSDGDTSFEYTSTAPGGELTFDWIWHDAGSSWEATIECVFPNGFISIDQQPIDGEICNNLVATLSIVASGPTINYQWQIWTGDVWQDLQNANGYAGVDTDNLKITTTSTFGAGLYRAHLTGSGLTVDSNPVELTVVACSGPSITVQVLTTIIGGSVSLDLAPLLNDPDNDLDLQTLKIVDQPQSGAPATLNGTVLTINYTGSGFGGVDVFSVEVCDLRGNCAKQFFNVDVAGDLVVYNAVSPNGDGKNDVFFLQYIDVLPSTKDNVVKIYNRWGDEVFSVSNYNNNDRVFKGENKNGNKLPSGTYFYKISFNGNSDDLSGYLDLRN